MMEAKGYKLSQEQVDALFELLNIINLEMLSDDGTISPVFGLKISVEHGRIIRSLYYAKDFMKNDN